MVIDMTEKDLQQVHGKLDNILLNIGKLNVSVGKIEEHLKNINGSIDRHEHSIGELYEFKRTDLKEVNEKIDWNQNKIYMAMGGIGILSLLAGTKAIGLW